MRPQRSWPRTARTSTLPRRSRATSMVSRSKNSWLRTMPDGMVPLRLLAPGIADLLARRVPAALVDVQPLVVTQVHRLRAYAWLARGDADAEVDAYGQLGRAVQILERMAHARGHVRCVVLVRVGHRDPELVTAEASACVSRADCTLQLMGEHADRLVTHAVAVLVVDRLQVVEVDHHQRKPSLGPVRRGDRAVDCPLELRPVGKTGEVIGASLFRVLARAVERDGDLVSDRGYELQVAGFERARQPRGHRHRAEQHALGAQLRADRAPLAGDAIDARLGRPRPDLHDLERSRPPADRELALLARLEPECLGQLEPRALAHPRRARLEVEHLQRLRQPDLRDLGHVERAAEGAGDVVQAVQLCLPCLVPRVRLLEVAADED